MPYVKKIGFITIFGLVLVIPNIALGETVQEMRARILKEMERQKIRTQELAEEQRQKKRQWEAEARLPNDAPSDLSASNYPSVAGTTWIQIDSRGGCYDLNFTENGELTVKGERDQTAFGGGAWKQVGDMVHMVCRKQLCVGSGRIENNKMTGQTKYMSSDYMSSDTYTWTAENNPVAGNCFARANLAPLQQRSAVTADQIKIAKNLGWAKDTSGEFELATSMLAQRIDVINAYKRVEALAKSGDVRAQNYLGDYNMKDSSLYGNAVEWYKLAAAKGHPSAANSLGHMYSNGFGTQKNEELARKWFLYADAGGDANADFNLGLIYERGLGVPIDLGQAIAWYRKAEERGQPRASEKLDILDVANKKARFAKKTQPSSREVANMVAARLSRYTLAGRLDRDHPDTLIQVFPGFGQLAKLKIIVRDLNCTRSEKSRNPACSFSVTHEFADGPIAQLQNVFAMDKSYSVEFLKGAEEWSSPQLDARIKAMGTANRAQGGGGYSSGRSGGVEDPRNPLTDVYDANERAAEKRRKDDEREYQRQEEARRNCPGQSTVYNCNR